LVGLTSPRISTASDRIRRTVALLQRRGYALSADRLAAMCLGGSVSTDEVRWAAAASPDLTIAGGLVVTRSAIERVADIRSRAVDHGADAAAYVQMTMRFVRALVALAPFIRSVSIAGSLASGGFRSSDDVDLNLIVDDGHRHLAYVVPFLVCFLSRVSHCSML